MCPNDNTMIIYGETKGKQRLGEPRGGVLDLRGLECERGGNFVFPVVFSPFFVPNPYFEGHLVRGVSKNQDIQPLSAMIRQDSHQHYTHCSRSP